MPKQRVLFLDIETSFLTVNTWGIRDQYIPHEQIVKDWTVYATGGRWQGDAEGRVLYRDQSLNPSEYREKQVLKFAWKLLNQADIVVGHNLKAFDEKRLNARFSKYGMLPPKPYKKYDTKLIAFKYFGFTSAKLAYLADFLDVKYKKLKHNQFPGNELWTECQKGNIEAWTEMRKYNQQDVLCLEGVYDKLIPWDTAIHPSLGATQACTCGNTQWERRGTASTSTGVYQLFRCTKCGKATRGTENLLSKQVRQGLKRGVMR